MPAAALAEQAARHGAEVRALRTWLPGLERRSAHAERRPGQQHWQHERLMLLGEQLEAPPWSLPLRCRESPSVVGSQPPLLQLWELENRPKLH